MAWKLGGLCPDGVFYIQLAQSIEHGHALPAAQLPLYPYPMLLALLHRAGLDWELAGTLWGVLMAGLVVLPLFGWLRRQFDQRVALAGCFLYAVHSELIRWSPEVMRDQTFWFLFVLSLYLLWRAVTEVRLWLFIAAGVTIALAAAMRFEGLLLLVPLGLWSCWRWRALGQSRGRLAAGTLCCAGRGAGAGGTGLARLVARLLGSRLVSAPGRCVGPGVDGVAGRAACWAIMPASVRYCPNPWGRSPRDACWKSICPPC